MLAQTQILFRKNLWRGGAALWADVGSKSAKIGNSLLDLGQRRQPKFGSEKRRERDWRKAVFVDVLHARFRALPDRMI
jgi:hypothetical protein